MKVPFDCEPEAIIGPTRYIGQTLPATADYPRPVDVFLGIPYGTSTAGPARFRRASLYVPTAEGRVYARDPGHTAPATGGVDEQMGEDCLNVQITRSRGGRGGGGGGGKVPVLVFFHGGAFNFGNGMTRNMRSLVAWAQADMVGVAVNYRLGVLGFAGWDAAQEDADANVGMWDMQLALEWVQRHVAAFGGDPGNVTVMGVSAGAHGIGHLLNAIPPATLFHRAILESGSPSARAVLAPTHPRPALLGALRGRRRRVDRARSVSELAVPADALRAARGPAAVGAGAPHAAAHGLLHARRRRLHPAPRGLGGGGARALHGADPGRVDGG
ncbi:hypothetical protein TD95_002784 [Thielaviopsis punctulata]|uniref:Carboxylic ester hydrolase n=1 Tax=Thielaviopsis punctulata TaxID=72032 RepID=A0A0F4ZEZ4_9PEZI|nr:hypothetical protein TD95_002784 [Thielaviopsis punctulata]